MTIFNSVKTGVKMGFLRLFCMKNEDKDDDSGAFSSKNTGKYR